MFCKNRRTRNAALRTAVIYLVLLINRSILLNEIIEFNELRTFTLPLSVICFFRHFVVTGSGDVFVLPTSALLNIL